MADEADAADALHQYWGLPEGMPLDEFLVSTELDDVQFGVDDVVVVVDFDGDLPMTLDTGDGIDDEFGGHVRPFGSVKLVERHRQIDGTPVDQIVEYLEDGVRRRWAPGNEIVHFDHLVARVHLVGQDRDVFVERHDGLGTGNPSRRVDVSLRQAVLQVDHVAHRRDAAPNRACTHGDEDVAVLPKVLERLDVLLIGDPAFDESDGAAFGDPFHVREGATENGDLLEQCQQPLVDVEEGQRASPAAAQADHGYLDLLGALGGQLRVQAGSRKLM